MDNGNKVVVLGGRRDWYGTTVPTYEIFDAQTSTWRSGKQLPEPDVYAVEQQNQDTLFAVLGYQQSGSKSMYRFVISIDAWEKITSFPTDMMQYPVRLARLPNGRFIVFGSGDLHPLFYLPDLK